MAASLAPLDRENARAALYAACAKIGLDAGNAVLVRLGENAVFRLHPHPGIARVARDVTRVAACGRQVRVARWLVAQSFPVVQPLDVPQPVLADGRVVTFWESVSDGVEYGSSSELGALLRRLHALPKPGGLELPTLDPFERARRRIEDLNSVASDDRAFLWGRCRELAQAYEQLSFVLPAGPIHGDANVGNVFRDRQGRPVLGDLDGFACGPREWDLVLTALYYERYGWHTEDEYEAFVRAYGFDIMTWPGYHVLGDVREFLMVTWLAQNAAEANVAAELETRLRALRTGASRRDWKPF